MKRPSVVLFVLIGVAGFAHAGPLAETSAQSLQPRPAGAGDAASGHVVRGGELVANAGGMLGMSAGSAGGLPGFGVDAIAPTPASYAEQIVSPPSPSQYEYFGDPVAIQGNTAFIGAPGAAGGGAVFVYTYADGTWSLAQTLTGDPAGGQFGVAVAIDGTTALIGANTATVDGNQYQGRAFVFTYADGTWTQSAVLVADNGTTNDLFGQSVALHGHTALIGAPQVNSIGNQYQGAAYVFTNTDGTWTQDAELTASDGAANNYFSFSLGLASETTAIVGCSGCAVDGVNGHGAAWVFNDVDGVWTQTQKLATDDPDAPGGMFFAYSLSVDGGTALFGAQTSGTAADHFQGGAYVYVESPADGTWSQTQKLVADNGVDGDGFGRAVALSGTSALIGAWGANGYQGTAYLFEATGGSFAQTQQFSASDGAAQDYYGYNVAVSGTTALVGAYNKTVNSIQAGQAYFYDEQDAEPAASVTPSTLSFEVATGATGSATLTVANTGSGALTYAFAEAAASGTRIALNLRSGSAERQAARGAAGIGAGGLAGPRAAAPWAPRDADGELSFVLDDGSYEQSVGLNDQVDTESAAIWLNRFTPPAGTGPFTIDSISILWPDNQNGTLVGKQVDLMAYYDADGDGDPSNAVRLGGDVPVTIDSLDDFVDYTVNFSVPGDGDIYVGFENTYALGGSSPILFPAAIDQNSTLQGRSWVSGKSSGDPDPNDLANNDLTGTIDSLGLPGNWLIRATGTPGGAGGGCSAPSDVPWLSETPSSGSVEGGASQDVTITADATGLDPGDYSVVLCITTNDPDDGLIQVPVSLSVSAGDRIFADGFDGS